MSEARSAALNTFRAIFDVLLMARRYRAVTHNRPPGQTLEQQRAEDPRVSMAEISLEGALLRAGLMTQKDEIHRFNLVGNHLNVELTDAMIKIPV